MILVGPGGLSGRATRRLGSVDQRPGIAAAADSDDPGSCALVSGFEGVHGESLQDCVHCPSIALTGIFEVSPSEGVGQPVT